MRIVGIDIGGTRIRVAARGEDWIAVADTPAELADLPEVIAGVGRFVDGADAIGVGCAGLVDHATGVVRWMPHTRGVDLRLGRILSDRFDAPVWVDNDANAATLAEATNGAGAGHRMVLGVFVGTGIGAGLVLDGRIERGRGHLGEVGHVRFADHGACRCGRVGCWEEHASGRALDRAAEDLAPGTDGAWLMARARMGETAARAAVDRVAARLSSGIVDLILTLDPDVVVVGGIAVAAGSVLFDAMEQHLADAGGGLAVAGLPPVLPASHGDRAGLEGAMIGAMEVLA